jgi:hypothetical protein
MFSLPVRFDIFPGALHEVAGDVFAASKMEAQPDKGLSD